MENVNVLRKAVDALESSNDILEYQRRKYPKDYDGITKKITKNNSMILDYLYRISQIEKNDCNKRRKCSGKIAICRNQILYKRYM